MIVVNIFHNLLRLVLTSANGQPDVVREWARMILMDGALICARTESKRTSRARKSANLLKRSSLLLLASMF